MESDIKETIELMQVGLGGLGRNEMVVMSDGGASVVLTATFNLCLPPMIILGTRKGVWRLHRRVLGKVRPQSPTGGHSRWRQK